MKNQYLKKVKPKSRYTEFIKVLNGILQFTTRECNVLAMLMQLDDEWTPARTDIKDILSTDSRRTVMRETLINKNNLSKYAKMFKEKGIITKSPEGGHIINDIFKPKNSKENQFEVIFIIDYNETK